ncbi:MAG: BrnT family toxin, partial [Gemmatimonadetes bacterium]|nr:BrnT family toxin [Gemmatimonadota bacterium]
LDTRWNLLFVVHIEIQNDEIRIISARKATRRERFDYEN